MKSRQNAANQLRVLLSDQVGADASTPGRLEFQREPVVDRQSRRFGILERVFRLQTREVGTFRPAQQLSDAIGHGIRGAMADLLNDEDENIDDRDRIFISMASDRLNNAYHFQGSTVGEWRHNGTRATEILDQLARMLNSNEHFEMNDTFQLSFVHVRRPPVGMGEDKKYLPGHQSLQRFKAMKRSCVAMPKDDAQLCAARAMVTAHGVSVVASLMNKPATTETNVKNGLKPENVFAAATELPVPCWAKWDYVLDPMALMN